MLIQFASRFKIKALDDQTIEIVSNMKSKEAARIFFKTLINYDQTTFSKIVVVRKNKDDKSTFTSNSLLNKKTNYFFPANPKHTQRESIAQKSK